MQKLPHHTVYLRKKITYFTQTCVNLCTGCICDNEGYKDRIARPAQVTKKMHTRNTKYSTNKFAFNYFFSQKLVNNSLELFHLPLTL